MACKNPPMPLHADRMALRVVFVLIGAALSLPFMLIDTTLIARLVQDTLLPLWVVVPAAALVVVAPPVALGLIPAMRTVEGAAASSLLGVELVGPLDPARTSAQRVRTLGWFVLHLLAGLTVVGGVLGSILAPGWAIGPLLVAVAVMTVLLGTGLARLAPRLLGPSYAERVALLERDVARAVERNRIAREIHDGVGHALSLIAVQAGAARRVIAQDPEFAAGALAAVEDAARDAAADLDHVLGLLREDGEPRRQPVADLGAFEGLVRATRAAGLAVAHDVSGDLRDLPPLVSREGYRVVQELLTNALRYSTDSSVHVTIVREDHQLRVTADNPAAPADVGTSRRGSGLQGLSERVQALGGNLEAGPKGDRWHLRATIPVEPASNPGGRA